MSPPIHSSDRRSWNETVPVAFDARVMGLVVVLATLAASLNVPYGGLTMGAVAFGTLLVAGVAGHVLGQRRLRRLVDGLCTQWVQEGGEIEAVTRSNGRMRTEWTVHTPDGPVTIGGMALAPISRLSVEWRGITDSMAATDAEDDLDAIAAGLYPEIFGSTPARSVGHTTP